MYQIIEYNDYHKENYIKLHGLTSDLDKAIRYSMALFKDLKEGDDQIEVVVDYKHIRDNEHVYFKNNGPIIKKFQAVEISGFSTTSFQDLFDAIDRPVPSSISGADVITRDELIHLVNTHVVTTDDIDSLDELGFEVWISSTVVAIVQGNEL